jgi:hypothetical protein
MPQAPGKIQPALYAGVAMGVLSALPLINLGNCLCCLWVIGGGALAAYLMQQNHPYPIESADGALVGLVAGLIGGAICGIIVIPIAMAMAPFQQQILDRITSNSDVPPEMKTMIENMTRGGVLGAMAIVGIFIRAIVFAIIAMIGGLLGVALFKRKDLPPPGTVEILPPV